MAAERRGADGVRSTRPGALTGQPPAVAPSRVGAGRCASRAVPPARPGRATRAAAVALALIVAASCAGAPTASSDPDDAPDLPARRPPAPEPDAPAPPRSGVPAVLPAPPIASVVHPVAAPVAPVPRAPGASGEIVRVAGRVVTTADLGDFVLRWHPDVASAAVARLTRIALVESEAAREGVSVSPETVEAATSRAFDVRMRRLRAEYGGDPADVLLRTTGRTPDDLRADLRAAVRTDLLRERLARLEALRRDGADLRVLVAPDERTAATAADQWKAGADASLLARRLGLADPVAPPPVALDDVPDAALRARLAVAPEGAVLDPEPFDGPDPSKPGAVVRAWQVLKVVRVWRGSAAPWSELGPRVEAWLASAPPTEAETDAWDARALGRNPAVRVSGPGGATSPPDGTMRAR